MDRLSAEIHLRRIDGTELTGNWLGVSDAGLLHVETAKGMVEIPIDDLSTVDFYNPACTWRGQGKATGDQADYDQQLFSNVEEGGDSGLPAVWHLADGGRVVGRMTSGDDQSVVVSSVLGQQARFPFERLAAARWASAREFPRAHALFNAALDSRLPGQDVLITRSADEPRVLRGRLTRMSLDGLSLIFGDRERSTSPDRLYGVVFATGATAFTPLPTELTLCDGTIVTGRIQPGPTGQLRVTTSLGFDATLPVEQVARIRHQSPRVAYLSELSPSAEQTQGILHRAWGVVRDRNLFGGPLSIAGRRFERGLACSSRTEITFPLQKGFDTFIATIGLDDSVRPNGRVVFRLLTDDVERFDSGLITGRDAPLDVRIDLSGAATLTLVVDYGDGLDLSDHAVWGDARLLKRKSP